MDRSPWRCGRVGGCNLVGKLWPPVKEHWNDVSRAIQPSRYDLALYPTLYSMLLFQSLTHALFHCCFKLERERAWYSQFNMESVITTLNIVLRYIMCPPSARSLQITVKMMAALRFAALTFTVKRTSIDDVGAAADLRRVPPEKSGIPSRVSRTPCYSQIESQYLTENRGKLPEIRQR